MLEYVLLLPAQRRHLGPENRVASPVHILYGEGLVLIYESRCQPITEVTK